MTVHTHKIGDWTKYGRESYSEKLLEEKEAAVAWGNLHALTDAISTDPRQQGRRTDRLRQVIQLSKSF